jgi:predicted AlkP superfamily phosphohydrolase/phosphomutase
MNKSPLVIIGIDAGDPELLEQWTADGTLPNLGEIMARGCWGRTTGTDLMFEHGAWMGIVTGVSRREHGYHHYRQLKQGTYELELTCGEDLGVRPFWAALQGAETRIAVVDVPETVPVPDLPGVQVHNYAVHNPQAPPVTCPSELLDEIIDHFGPSIVVAEQYESNLSTDLAIHQKLVERVAKKGALCRHLHKKDNFDLFFAVFSEAHTGGHQFWKYRPEAQGLQKAAAPNPLMHAVQDFYQAVDREIGELLKLVPADANVFVISSVGMLDCYPMGGLIADFCAKLGYTAAAVPGKEALTPLGLARQLFPESWRVAVSKRLLSREARESLLSDQFRGSADWSRTRAFASPSTFMGFLWVNLRGRQPQGIVEPGDEYARLLQDLTADLQQLIDPQSGEPAVRRVWHSCEVFAADPLQLILPDLLVEWVPQPYFIETLSHPRAALRQKKPEFFRGTDHKRYGFIAAAGPAVSGRQYIGEVEVLDLSPTFLHLLGSPPPAAMKGRLIPQFTGANIP